MAATITKLDGKFRLSFMSVTVGTSGASATNDTGLNGVSAAMAINMTSGALSGAGAPFEITLKYATSSGNVAVYAWESDGTAATAGSVTVHVLAIGT